MLTADQAKEQLSKYCTCGDKGRRAIRAEGLLAPRLARRIADNLNDQSGAHDPEAADVVRSTAMTLAGELDDLSEAKRAKVFAALSPSLGAELAHWWGWAQARPYVQGWSGVRPYRSSDPAITRSARWQRLASLLHDATHYPQPIEWHASWLLYTSSQYGPDPVGELLASALDAGNHAVRRILMESIDGTHSIGGPSQPGYVALLAASDPDAWEFVGRQLLAAGRAEGLRQTILGSLSLAHPDALTRFVEIIVENDLVRFSSAILSVAGWAGEELTTQRSAQVAEALAATRRFLQEPPDIDQLRAAAPVEVVFGLWSLAVRDVSTAIAAAAALIHDADARRRLAATRILVDVAHPEAAAPLAAALADADLSVFVAALGARPTYNGASWEGLVGDVGASLRQRLLGWPPSLSVDIGLLAPQIVRLKKSDVADALAAFSGDEDVDLEFASADARRGAARRFAKDPVRYREQLFILALDASESVRREARRALDVDAITIAEALTLERALTRKTDDVRKTALRLLLKQSPAALAASVERLGAGKPDQRRAAEELAQIAGLKPTADEGASHEGALAEGTPATTEGIDAAASPSADDRPPLLRYGVEDRTPAERPLAPPRSRWTAYHPGARRIWQSLGAWLDEHANLEVQTRGGVEMLANIRGIQRNDDGSMPLGELLDPWWERIRGELVDGGVELVLLRLLQAGRGDAAVQVLGSLGDERSEWNDGLRREMIRHLAWRECRASWAEPVLDLFALVAGELPTDELIGPRNVVFGDDRKRVGRDPRELSWLLSYAWDYLDPSLLDDQQLHRLWRIVRFLDEPEGAVDQWAGPKAELVDPSYWGAVHIVADQPFRYRPPSNVVFEAFARGIATRADLIDHLFTRPALSCELNTHRLNPLEEASALKATDPAIQAIVEEVQRTVVGLEITRGDRPTPYSRMAMSLQRVTGVESLAGVLKALGRRPFVRGYLYADKRESVFSHLVRIHHPATDDSVESIAHALSGAKISESRIIETAMYAPQWAEPFEEHLAWPGFASAIWWVHAHTTDSWRVPEATRSWQSDQALGAARKREIDQRTPLSTEDRDRGSADAEWFHRLYAELGDDRLDRVLNAAKYASNAAEHKQAELFANAMRGRVTEDELLTRMYEKRHQDAVRAYGLLPLSGDPDQLLRRYEVLRAFVSTGKTNGPQRRATETAAVHAALENLARSAGYRDPQRLIWAMEARAGEDLSRGAVTAVDGDVTVSLTIDDLGMPEITVDRAGKTLAAVPAKSRKAEEIAALTTRARDLRKQAQRVRASLEAACVLGDVIDASELALLQAHPILGRMLSDLVMVDGEGRTGFLSAGGDELVNADASAFRAVGGLRIAHPLDLLASGDWPDLQRAVMTRERPQPFKQVFRELYVLNENEKAEKGISSRRYVGHQLASRRASGLFISRGWISEYGFGFGRTFHNEKVTAFCNIEGGWGTAGEVEEAAVDDVRFAHAGTHIALPLADVPPRVFSETMRDLDLVVSVAHASGVDPQASESSIEMRQRLVDETCRLLGLENVEVDGHHARVKGALGIYSVHLGSGIVHRIPGNTLFIIPVGAQHRGRVFLPFVDDDPRTAEIVSKVVMLSRDEKITDPTILSQIVR
ncbi:DUF4132 domain-containing protein [Microbacterium luteolum]|uniref:DUF4132 domain-containing protein n=1 Tax=Microbacterium luteolum TaxID=69367 RepID=A0ABY7XVL6_MICLT|nr:DUF4132 domain-containing protein [Microbacterium luteolum]WDM43988.1 DUF4132 domain-containing protein [Microbacterium luteolum]